MNAREKGLSGLLEEGVVLCAEGFVFELERRGYVKSGPYVPEVVLDHPEAVTELHREFARAGSDIVLALTYYAHEDKMKVVGRGADTEQLNREAVKIAKAVADDTHTLLAGNISNTWTFDANNVKESSERVRSMYRDQVRWAAEEGAEPIIAETLDYLGEAKLALEVIKEFNLPAVINLTTVSPTTGDGHTYDDACKQLEDLGADVVGLNCGRGPATLMPLVNQVIDKVSCPVAALPVVYRTDDEHLSFIDLKQPGRETGFPSELDPFVLTRSEMAEFAVDAERAGTKFIGICCGGAPHHMRAMAEALGRSPAASAYSPDISRHALLGDEDVVSKGHREFHKDHHSHIKTG